MTTKMSSKGQVVVPQSVRRRLGLNGGDSFSVAIVRGNVILKPLAPAKPKGRIGKDPVTGLPVLTGAAGRVITHKEIRDILDAEFP